MFCTGVSLYCRFICLYVETQAGNQFILINQHGVLHRSFPVLSIHLSLYWNSSWESVHSDKSARYLIAPEFPCIADSFVFMCWNSSWESVHSDKSARCFAPEFPCIADSFVFMCWNSSWESVHSDKSARCFAPEFSCYRRFICLYVETQAGNQVILINQRGALHRSFPVVQTTHSIFMRWNAIWESLHSTVNQRVVFELELAEVNEVVSVTGILRLTIVN